MINHSLINPDDKIVLTGGAGLVGHNLVLELKKQGYNNIVVLDKNKPNLDVLERQHSDVVTIHSDLSEAGNWAESFADAACVIMLQAQITGKTREQFVRNNVTATEHILGVIKNYQVPYLVHISSSVVVSVADDEYTRTKAAQEEMVVKSGLAHCVLRPTLMFGWFDPKHLGWLARFMEKTPVFPIPGHGRYSRQPLYIRDFCKIIIRCMQTQPKGDIYDVVGDQHVDYVDIIREIKKAKALKTLIIHLPMWLFSLLMRVYAIFSRYPPFTNDQLIALTAGDNFVGIDTEKVFGVKQQLFQDAIHETFNDPDNSHVLLKRTGMEQ